MKCLIVGVLISAISVALVSAGETVCSAECLQHLLGKENGSEISDLYKSLLYSSPGPLVTVEVNGKTYIVSTENENALQSARNLGVKDHVLDLVFDEADLLPLSKNTTDPQPRTVKPVPGPTSTPSSASSDWYRFYRDLNAELTIRIKGVLLRLPKDLDRLLTLNLSKVTLTKITEDLHDYGLSYTYDTKTNVFKPLNGTPSKYSSCLCRARPRTVHIESFTYKLPNAWYDIRADIYIGNISRARTYQELQALNISVPRLITDLSNSFFDIFVSEDYTKGQASKITIGYGYNLYQLPRDKDVFEQFLIHKVDVVRFLEALYWKGVHYKLQGNKIIFLTPNGDISLSGLHIPSYKKRVVQSNSVKVRVRSMQFNLPRDRRVIGQRIAAQDLQIEEVVDAIALAGGDSQYDKVKQEIVAHLADGTIRISTQSTSSNSTSKVPAETLNANYDYTIFLQTDEEFEKIKLPSQIETLNSYIRSGKIDKAPLIYTLDQLGLADNLHKRKKQSYLTLNGTRYDIALFAQLKRV